MKDFITIPQATQILFQEGVVALPAETVYGLGALINSETALKKIFSIKGRPFFDPLIVHVNSLSLITDYVINPDPILIKLAQRFWPGPLTLIFNKNPKTVSDLITSGQSTVAIRWPKHEIFESVIEKVKIPIAAPSANPFKKTSPTEASHVRDYFPELPVLDGGPSFVGLESTIVRLNNNTLEILRPGGVSIKDLKDFIKTENLNLTVAEKFDLEGPGSMKEHYQPQAPLYLFLNTKFDPDHSDFKNKKIKIMNLPNDPQLCARFLYKTLIDDSKNADVLVYQWTHDVLDPDWSTIFNRLKKAAKVIDNL